MGRGEGHNGESKAASIILCFLRTVEGGGILAPSSRTVRWQSPSPEADKGRNGAGAEGLQCRAQCRQKDSCSGTRGGGTGSGRASWGLLGCLEPLKSGLDWLMESKSADHQTPHMRRQHGQRFLHLSPVFFPCPYVLVFPWCHLNWLSSTCTCFRREVTAFSSSATRDSRFSLEEDLGAGASFLGEAGLCLAGFSSG